MSKSVVLMLFAAGAHLLFTFLGEIWKASEETTWTDLSASALILIVWCVLCHWAGKKLDIE